MPGGAIKRALVTGATGFIGGHLVERLLVDGYHVRALVRPTSDVDRLKERGVDVVLGDVKDPASLEKAVADCEHVYHVAAVSGSTSQSNREYGTTNVTGSANVGVAAVRAGVRRFVHVSSCGVYGFRNRLPTDETAPLRPDTPYRLSKARGERAVLDCSEGTGLSVVIARIGATYGPGATKWVRMCRSIQSGGFRMIGDGRNRLHLGHVSDIVTGLRLCAEIPAIEGRVYNLAAAEPIRMGELVAIFSSALDARPQKPPWPAFPFYLSRKLDLALTRALDLKLRRLHSYDLFLGDRYFDISRARRELGYEPRVATKDGLRQLVEGYRQAGLLA